MGLLKKMISSKRAIVSLHYLCDSSSVRAYAQSPDLAPLTVEKSCAAAMGVEP